nr:MAG TPA: hypothetical protein [Caudoviricetes sp.]DAV17053.1 MAG TPA: hypothetical protein [Caudoviricetes sp.]
MAKPVVRSVRVNPEMQFTTDDLLRMLFGVNACGFADKVRNDTSGEYDFLLEDDREERKDGKNRYQDKPEGRYSRH